MLTNDNSETTRVETLKHELANCLGQSGTARIPQHRFREVWPTLNNEDLSKKIEQFISSNGWECRITDFQRTIEIWDSKNPAYHP